MQPPSFSPLSKKPPFCSYKDIAEGIPEILPLGFGQHRQIPPMPQSTVLGISHSNNLLQEQRDDVISMEHILDRVTDPDPHGSALI
jgi:hypothetical protein